MSLKFDRIQAGEYQINDGTKMVGYIRKQTASKWIMYKCSNPALLGSPISVQKTLKQLKIEAETLIGSTCVTPKVSVNSQALDSLIKDVRDMKSEKELIMKEMLGNDYVIDLTEYKFTDDGFDSVETEDELIAF